MWFRLILFLSLLSCSQAEVTQKVVNPPDIENSATVTEGNPQESSQDTLEEKLDQYVQSFGKNWGEAFQFSGHILIAKEGKILYDRGFGFANRAKKLSNTKETNFRIGSVTKQFTAIAILQLQEKGLLSVKDPIKKHLPNYPEVGKNITIHQLLTHTSGIPSYTNDPEFMKTRNQTRTLQELIAVFSEKSLEFQPGAQFSYSNSGYVLLGAIIEAVSKQNYSEYLQKNLFTPAGLNRTVYGDALNIENRSEAYDVDLYEKVQTAPAIDMSIPYSAGAVRSTSVDLLKWHQALSQNEILNEESKKQMYTPEKSNYAYGWFLRNIGEKKAIEHGGGIDGFQTQYSRFIEDDLVIIAWTNMPSISMQALMKGVIALSLGNETPLHQETKPVALDQTALTRIAGTYTITEESRKTLLSMGIPKQVLTSISSMEVLTKDQIVLLRPIGQEALRLHPESPSSFFAKRLQFNAKFSPESGTVNILEVKQGRVTVKLERKKTP